MSTDTILFDFDACIRLPQSFQVFHNFLEKEEHNVEPLDFLKQVEAFQQKVVSLLDNIEQNTKWLQQCQETYQAIYKEFIVDTGSKQLNLDHSKRQIIQNRIQEMDTILIKWQDQPISIDSLRTKLYHLYDEVKISIAFQLRSDSFPRFVRYPIWLQFCQQNHELVEQFLKKTKFIKMMTTAEFYDPIFNDRDIDLVKYFITDSNKWKRVGSIKCVYAKKHHDCVDFYDFTDPFVISDIPRLKKVVCHKYTNTMPFHYKKILFASMGKNESDPVTTVLQRYIPTPENMEHGKYAFAKVISVRSFPFLKTRENFTSCVFLKVRLEDGTKAVMRVVKSINDATVPLQKKGNMRAEVYGCDVYIKVSKTLTRIVRAVFLYWGGVLEKFFKLFEKGLQKFVAKENQSLYLKLENLQKNDFKDLDDSYQFRSLFEYNKNLDMNQ